MSLTDQPGEEWLCHTPMRSFLTEAQCHALGSTLRKSCTSPEEPASLKLTSYAPVFELWAWLDELRLLYNSVLQVTRPRLGS